MHSEYWIKKIGIVWTFYLGSANEAKTSSEKFVHHDTISRDVWSNILRTFGSPLGFVVVEIRLPDITNIGGSDEELFTPEQWTLLNDAIKYLQKLLEAAGNKDVANIYHNARSI